MAYHNPFIVNGKIRFPANTNLVRHVEKCRAFVATSWPTSWTFPPNDIGVARHLVV